MPQLWRICPRGSTTSRWCLGHDHLVPKTPPESTKNSLSLRLFDHARDRWSRVPDVETRFRGAFAYVDATLTDGAVLPLMRLRYLGSAHTWGFAIYLASNGKYQDSVLPSGNPTGTPEGALDCACGLYLTDPPPGNDPRRTSDQDH